MDYWDKKIVEAATDFVTIGGPIRPLKQAVRGREGNLREWVYDKDGLLTEEAVAALEEAARSELYGMGVLIASAVGVYVAPKGAIPGDGEWYYGEEYYSSP